jgi:hypothetical protein
MPSAIIKPAAETLLMCLLTVKDLPYKKSKVLLNSIHQIKSCL